MPACLVPIATAANTGIEPIIAELLRTRLVEGGLAVEAYCVKRCMETGLQESAVDAPKPTSLTAGQIPMVGGASVPFVGGLIRTLGEQEREQEQATSRSKGSRKYPSPLTGEG